MNLQCVKCMKKALAPILNKPRTGTLLDSFFGGHQNGHLSLKKIGELINNRPCVQKGRCTLVRSDADTWRRYVEKLGLNMRRENIYNSSVASATKRTLSEYIRADRARNGGNNPHAYDYALGTLFGEGFQWEGMLVSKPARMKSTWLLTAIIILIPIECPQCTCDYTPLYQYNRRYHQGMSNPTCPFCGKGLQDWGVLDKKQWSYLDRTALALKEVVKWSM